MSAGHAHAKAPAYRRRTPEEEPLYQVLAEHLESFLERTRSSDRQLPAYVEEELRAYLDCGILAHGFLRVRCEDCDQDRVVAFSCQRRCAWLWKGRRPGRWPAVTKRPIFLCCCRVVPCK